MNEGFLDAIRDQPDDDATRLIYADWLDDQGESDRAEFIRLQISLQDSSPVSAQKPILEEQSREMICQHGERWLGGRPASLKEWSFRGGLVDRLVFDAKATIADIEPLLHRHPVSDLVLDISSLLPLTRSPVLGLVRGLTVASRLILRAGKGLEHLLDSPLLRKLYSLSLHGEGVDNHLARALVLPPSMKSLRKLRLRETTLSDAGLVQLLRQGVLPDLEDWDVHSPNASRLGVENLFSAQRAPKWKGLTCPTPREANLDLSRYLRRCINVRRLHAVLRPRSPWESGPVLRWLRPLKQLRELHLGGNPNEEVVEALANWPGLAQLEHLHLSVAPGRQMEVRERLHGSPYRNPEMALVL